MFTLAPQGRAIAAVVLGFALVTGGLTSLMVSVVSLFGDSFPDGRPGLVLYGAIAALVAGGVFLLALPGTRIDGWPGHLSQAAVVLVLIHLLTVVLYVLAGLIHGDDESGTYFLGILNFFGGTNY